MQARNAGGVLKTVETTMATLCRIVLAGTLAVSPAAVESQITGGATATRTENARLRARVDSLERVIAALRKGQGAAKQPGANTLASLLPARLSEPYEGEIEVKYDRFNNLTGGSLGGIKVRNSAGGDEIDITVLFAVPGEHREFPESVFLRVWSSSRDWRYLRCHSLTFLADGQRVATKPATHDGSVETYGVLEKIGTEMPTSEFFKMAGAARVEGKLCNVEFSLNIKQVFALREFANRMKPAVP